MGKNAKSARGEIVDFDLIKIKEQMASAPPSTDVKARQDFVDRRLHRRVKRAKAPAPKIAAVEVEPTVPSTEDPVDPPVEEPQAKAPAKKAATKQKARPAKKS